MTARKTKIQGKRYVKFISETVFTPWILFLMPKNLTITNRVLEYVFFHSKTFCKKLLYKRHLLCARFSFVLFDYFSSTAYSPLYNPWVPWTNLTIDSNFVGSNYYMYGTNSSIRILCGFYLWQQVIHLNYLPNYHYLH